MAVSFVLWPIGLGLLLAGAAYLGVRAYRLFEYNVNLRLNQHALAMRGQLDGRALPGVPIARLVVSLTTIRDRLPTATLAIQSILLQTMRPEQVVLYLSDEIPREVIPPALLALEKYGLRIAPVRDIGPFTKLIPALADYRDHTIITIDDDVYYPAHTVECLLRTAAAVPGAIVGNWVRRLAFDWRGRVRAAKKGRLITTKLMERNIDQPRRPVIAGHDLFAYGTSGVLYPPGCFDERVFDEASFKALCPTEDDVWFKAMAILKGTPVAASHLGLSPRHFCLMGSQAVALRHGNYAARRGQIAAGEQIRNVFAHFAIYDRLKELKGGGADPAPPVPAAA